MKSWLLQCWTLLRQLSGDDAYERYLRHQLSQHPDEPPLDRKSFFKREQERKWHGIKRCC
ncbi:YbdD/YjiX family protein [Rheinheimera riviphila]|uniref:YbdD/YjiX family protein n=1 Tax=Rheinheimera riviphila TaxID=1834037 RepID=A0A437R0C2_9GAMM|nr:YbdD/YjiX family protein [Rheinheimera riviphila]RVU40235.1 YbdD/YjiX family protein [Rheinheimera riviphila]